MNCKQLCRNIRIYIHRKPKNWRSEVWVEWLSSSLLCKVPYWYYFGFGDFVWQQSGLQLSYPVHCAEPSLAEKSSTLNSKQWNNTAGSFTNEQQYFSSWARGNVHPLSDIPAPATRTQKHYFTQSEGSRRIGVGLTQHNSNLTALTQAERECGVSEMCWLFWNRPTTLLSLRVCAQCTIGFRRIRFTLNFCAPRKHHFSD